MDRENALEAIFEDDPSDGERYFSDVEMMDADPDVADEQLEDGELKPCATSGIDIPEPYGHEDASLLHGENDLDKAINNAKHSTQSRRSRRKRHKKKKNQTNSIASINRFVIDTCRRLREPKSYLVWEAVRNLGVCVVKGFMEEVYTIESSGGQMTADGKRRRTAGGILWNILKSREPDAYKEIMLKGKQFEKQLRTDNGKWHATDLDGKLNIKRSRMSSCDPARKVGDQAIDRSARNSFQLCEDVQFQNSFSEDICQGPLVKAWVEGIRIENAVRVSSHGGDLNIQDVQDLQKSKLPVRDRIRVPVEYDDLIGHDTTDHLIDGKEESRCIQDAM